MVEDIVIDVCGLYAIESMQTLNGPPVTGGLGPVIGVVSAHAEFEVSVIGWDITECPKPPATQAAAVTVHPLPPVEKMIGDADELKVSEVV